VSSDVAIERPDRDGKTLVAAWMHEPLKRAVDIGAAERGVPRVAAWHLAVGLMLTAYGKEIPPELDAVLAKAKLPSVRDFVNGLADRKSTAAPFETRMINKQT
jgi:hypothetical protein